MYRAACTVYYPGQRTSIQETPTQGLHP